MVFRSVFLHSVWNALHVSMPEYLRLCCIYVYSNRIPLFGKNHSNYTLPRFRSQAGIPRSKAMEIILHWPSSVDAPHSIAVLPPFRRYNPQP